MLFRSPIGTNYSFTFIDIDYESKRIISAYWLDKNDCLVTYDVEFEEGRFYPITKALEYQGKEDAK